MKKLIVILCAMFVLVSSSGAFAATHTGRAHAVTHMVKHATIVSICTLTGLTGAARQESQLFCSVNILPSPAVTTNGAGSVYLAAVHLAAAKGIVVGFPTSVVVNSVNGNPITDWSGGSGVPITYVNFSLGGYHAEHYNPSGGHVRIYNALSVLVWSE